MPLLMPPGDAPLFRAVQAQVAEIADELLTELLADVEVDPSHLGRARELVQSRRAEVELTGLRAFERQRRLHGDRVRLDWKPYARRMMAAKLAELFRGPEGGGDDESDGPLRPLGSGGLPRVLRDAPPSVPCAHLPLPRPGVTYIATREQLMATAIDLAFLITDDLVGGWSADSAVLVDIAMVSARKGADRCERSWDPELGSLFHYLRQCVWFEVKEQYRNACKSKERDAFIREWLASEAEDRMRRVAAGDTQEAEDAREEEELERFRAFLARALPSLSDRQREQIEHRLNSGSPGTNADQLAYGRAVRKLRRRWDDEQRRDAQAG